MLQPETPRRSRLGWAYALAFLPAAALTWGPHELAHWAMGRLLGYRMWISLNQVGLVEGEYDSVRDRILVALAGPLVTGLQALLSYELIERWRKPWLYPLLFLTVWTRGLAMVVSLKNPNDEAEASALLGLSPWVLPTLVVTGLLLLTIAGSRKLRLGWRANLVAYLMSSLVTAAIVLADQGHL